VDVAPFLALHSVQQNLALMCIGQYHVLRGGQALALRIEGLPFRMDALKLGHIALTSPNDVGMGQLRFDKFRCLNPTRLGMP